jgi:hypothetical protein
MFPIVGGSGRRPPAHSPDTDSDEMRLLRGHKAAPPVPGPMLMDLGAPPRSRYCSVAWMSARNSASTSDSAAGSSS